MSQIEMVGSGGYTLTVDVSDPSANYASLAAGLTVTEVTSTVYRASLGSLSGLVYCLFKVGSIRFSAGYANLDSPGVNGYSEVFDTLEQARAATELLKVPRADAVLASGGAAQRCLDGSFTDYIEEKIRKVP